MFELITAALEAISGYLVGKFGAKSSRARYSSLVFLSFVLGGIFFISFGVYELIFPSANPKGNIWVGLICFSIGISFITYLILLIDRLIKNRKRKQGRAAFAKTQRKGDCMSALVRFSLILLAGYFLGAGLKHLFLMASVMTLNLVFQAWIRRQVKLADHGSDETRQRSKQRWQQWGQSVSYGPLVVIVITASSAIR